MVKVFIKVADYVVVGRQSSCLSNKWMVTALMRRGSRDNGNDYRVPEIGSDNSRFSYISLPLLKLNCGGVK